MTNRRKRKNEFMTSLLRSWYGKERGDAETLRYTPEPGTLSEHLDKELKRLLPPWEWKVMLVRLKWEEIAGPENARRCAPAFFNNGVFYIEVSHPAYRIALEAPPIKKQLLERIREIIGGELCQSIKFIAGGRTAPRGR